jgi:ADP-heptose:LPS heptosyltransferase
MLGLDLVITCDTSIAHLAGGLGVPGWVALPHVPDWRWMLERPDSPWYPSLRLYRQAVPGDWSHPFQTMARDLANRPLAPGA